MSSTNRKNAKERHVSDYYVTPKSEILRFFEEWVKDECEDQENDFVGMCSNIAQLVWRDPCAGGDEKNDMSYPSVLREHLMAQHVETIDVREDSLADVKGNFLDMELGDVDITVTNPPFNLALPIIEKALKTTQEGGYVIMLLRLNFLGSQSRKAFWDTNPAHRIYVHHKRMSFTDDGSTDSIEYAHFVWRVGKKDKATIMRVI